MILQMAKESGWKFNPTISNALFLGILTDSGRFQYLEDFPLSFHEVAFLCENGANPKAINDILNQTVESALKFRGYVFNNYKKTKTGVVYLTFNFDVLQRLHVSPSKAGTMVNLLSNVIGYPIWAFFCENEDFNTAVTITRVLIQHTSRVFQDFPKDAALNPASQSTLIRQRFFDALPAQFDRSTYISVAQRVGMPPKTAEKAIARFKKDGLLIHETQNRYSKR